MDGISLKESERQLCSKAPSQWATNGLSLNFKTENGEGIFLCDGPNPEKIGGVSQFAVTKKQLDAYKGRESYVPIIQLVNIVWPGLILAEHIFQGLKRPLLYEENKNGDEQKLVFTWRSKFDYDWGHDRRFDSEGPTRRDPPPGLVFAVSTTPNCKAQFPSVNFWIDRWYWIEEEQDGYPVDWQNRYGATLR